MVVFFLSCLVLFFFCCCCCALALFRFVVDSFARVTKHNTQYIQWTELLHRRRNDLQRWQRLYVMTTATTTTNSSTKWRMRYETTKETMKRLRSVKPDRIEWKEKRWRNKKLQPEWLYSCVQYFGELHSWNRFSLLKTIFDLENWIKAKINRNSNWKWK